MNEFIIVLGFFFVLPPSHLNCLFIFITTLWSESHTEHRFTLEPTESRPRPPEATERLKAYGNLCFLSLSPRLLSLVQKCHNKLIAAQHYARTRGVFDCAENVNQFSEEGRSNWKEMSIKRLVSFIVPTRRHQPLQPMF